MLRKLFSRKPRLQAEDPATRIAALADLDDGSQAAFAGVFLDDPDPSVRHKALERLTDLDVIFSALTDTDVAAEAVARLVDLVDDDTPTAIRNHPNVLRAGLATAQTEERAIAIASRVEDASALAEGLADNPSAHVRLSVVEATWNPAVLGELEKAARRRDKSMHRLARDRLATLRTASARRSEEDDQTEAILAAAVALKDEDPHYEARRDAVERDWAGNLDAMQATDEELARFGTVARDINAIRSRFPVRRQSKTPEVDTGADFGELLAKAEALHGSIVESLSSGVDENTPTADFKDAADELAGEWNAAADAKPPGDELSVRFRDAMASAAARSQDRQRALTLAPAAREVLASVVPDPDTAESFDAAVREIRRQDSSIDQLLDRYAWPEHLPRLAEIEALEQRKRDLAIAAEQSQSHSDGLVEEVSTGLAELRRSIEDGAVHDAVERDRELRELVKRLPRGSVQALSAEFAELGARVRELREWRTYAQAPEREALCRQVEEIAANPLEPHEQMRVVKSLREQWNELGGSDTRNERELKRRFDDAAEQAFEPCREYFKEQAEQRAFNLEQRETIVSALEGFLENNDWEHADWRGVDRILRQARAEWRRYHPVDRKAGRTLATRFEELANDIHALLKREWDRNIELKETIVAEAGQVRESGVQVTDQAETMKALQRRWKSVGPLPRRVDQRLWKQFREECDMVFEARSAVHTRHSQRRQIMEDADALITELERRVEIDPGLDRNMIADYERRLHDLGSLPRELERRADEMLRDADRIVVARHADNPGDD